MTPALTTIVRVGAWTLVGTFAALGLIAASPAVVWPALVAAGVGAAMGWALVRERSLQVALGFGAACGIGVLAIAGLGLLAGPATLIVAPAVVAPLVWTHRKRPRQVAEQEAVAVRSPLAALSNAQLAQEWHVSYTALTMARDPGSLELIYALRRHQLDEIERRAPSGSTRWISSGSWVRSDSAPFLGG